MRDLRKMNMNACRKRLARQIAQILANPAIPSALHNAITEELTFYTELADYHVPCVVEMSLLAYEQNRKEMESEIEENQVGELIG